MRLSQLNTLTPGDFAIVVRGARGLGEPYDSERLMVALEEECRAKQRGMKPVAGGSFLTLIMHGHFCCKRQGANS